MVGVFVLQFLMARVVLVDGSWLTYRAFFAIPADFKTSSGFQTNAIYGFATMFRKLFAGKRPEYGAVIFDPKGPTVRDKKFPAYKAQRPPTPKELIEQFPFIDKVVQANNFPLLRVDGYEADDVIGTLATKAKAAGHDVIIVSGDKDFAQLVDEKIKMMDTMRDVTYDADLVEKKWGVPPHQIADYLGLVGDSADNIPGVSGIGPKGAVDLLTKYKNLDGILANIDKLKPKQAQTFQTETEKARISLELAIIDCDAPVGVELEAIKIQEPDARGLNKLYRELQFNSLLAKEEREGRAVEPPLQLQDKAEWNKLLKAAEEVVLVPVFDAATGYDRKFLGAVGLVDEKQFYVYDSLAECVKEVDAVPKLVFHDCKDWFFALVKEGVVLRPKLRDAFDTRLASYLIDPAGIVPHDIDKVSKEYLQSVLPTLKEEPDPIKLAGIRARAIKQMTPALRQKLTELNQDRVLQEMEIPLSSVLARMEIDGVLVDHDSLSRLSIDFTNIKEGYEKRIYELAGKTFNVGSPKQVGEVLFDELKLPVIKKVKTGYSTDAEVLERLKVEHPIAELILEQRKYAKLINTYTDVLQSAVNPSTGRIHATLNQTIGVSGRLISTDPDLQRTPVKSTEGKRVREAFIAPQGKKLISADWSQIELRVLAHFSDDKVLKESYKHNWDVHAKTASEIFHVPENEVTKEQRGVGKTINFATVYGQGATSLSQILGITKKDAQDYIDTYFKVYAGVRTWLDETSAFAMKHGYVTTLSGRRRVVKELFSNSIMEQQAGLRMAINTPIQGSAADICKLAMIQIDKKLKEVGPAWNAKMLLQVHDELLFECNESNAQEFAEMVQNMMENCVELNVPLVCNVGVGDSWAEVH